MASFHRVKRNEVAFIVLIVSGIQIIGNLLYLLPRNNNGYSSSLKGSTTPLLTTAREPAVLDAVDNYNNENNINLPATPDATDVSRGSRSKPSWAKKLESFADSSPPEHRICFVHVGKTAGSTLACYLGFRYDCGSEFETSTTTSHEFLLSRYTTDVIHRKYNGCDDGDFSYYLFTLRNPLERIVSWFAYENPSGPESNYYEEKKPLFVDCYSTLNDLAERGLGGHDDREACPRRAWRAVLGTRGYCCHNYHNFGYYLQQVDSSSSPSSSSETETKKKKKRRIVAIRTEHVLEDWNSIERMLGGKRTLNVTLARINVSREQTTKEDDNNGNDNEDQISQTARLNLCHALCQEIQVYKQLLNRVENLSKEQVNTSLQELLESCPRETKEIRSCGYKRRSIS